MHPMTSQFFFRNLMDTSTLSLRHNRSSQLHTDHTYRCLGMTQTEQPASTDGRILHGHCTSLTKPTKHCCQLMLLFLPRYSTQIQLWLSLAILLKSVRCHLKSLDCMICVSIRQKPGVHERKHKPSCMYNKEIKNNKKVFWSILNY